MRPLRVSRVCRCMKWISPVPSISRKGHLRRVGGRSSFARARSGSVEPQCERKIIANLAYRAFRGPVSQQKIDQLVAISQGAQKRGGSFEEGISLALATILASPSFLFRIDSEVTGGQARPPISQYPLASRAFLFFVEQHAGRRTAACGRAGDLESARCAPGPSAAHAG